MENVSSKIVLLFAFTLLFAGCYPLQNAIYKGDTKEIERLIAEGADVNVDSGGPLRIAAEKGDITSVNLLIEKGANVNAKNEQGLTPLHMAAMNGNKEIVEILLSKGADVNAKNYYGAIPLVFAKGRGHLSIVSILENPKFSAKVEPINTVEEAAFTEAARSYRITPVKPTLPEEARKLKVQAEYAFSKKEFEGAAARYKEALNVAPWWPEGHFNRALILGELSRFRDAIREMNKYLALVPDAPNAQAAQDNIYRWEGELK